MDRIVILLKTFEGDLSYVERLYKSYLKYNRDNIPLHIVVPQDDLNLFHKFSGKNVKLHSDESITDELVLDDSVRGIRPGYINQEIIKLAFWEKKLCENYFCMDSDGVFIRDFYESDFMFDDKTPYTILTEDNELRVDPEYYRTHWVGREKLIRNIQESIGLNDRRMLTCHGFAIFSSKVLESLYNKFLIPNNMSYKDILSIAPYEFSWYNMWLQKDNAIPLKIKEPVIKFFHQKSHHLNYVNQGIKIEDIARGYIGYNINSNYSRGYGIINYSDIKQYKKSSINTINSFVYNKIIKPIKKSICF